MKTLTQANRSTEAQLIAKLCDARNVLSAALPGDARKPLRARIVAAKTALRHFYFAAGVS
jgi:hypothetical protein